MHELNDEEVSCNICLDGGWDDANMIVLCDNCPYGTHQVCYGVHVIPEGNWFCDLCAFKKKHASKNIPESQYQCVVCLQHGGMMVPFKTSKNRVDPQFVKWVHSACVLNTPELSFKNVDNMRIPQGLGSYQLTKRKKKKCDFCENIGAAVLSCNERGCRAQFHISCGKENGCLFQVKAQQGPKEAFCPHHKDKLVRKLQKLTSEAGNMEVEEEVEIEQKTQEEVQIEEVEEIQPKQKIQPYKLWELGKHFLEIPDHQLIGCLQDISPTNSKNNPLINLIEQIKSRVESSNVSDSKLNFPVEHGNVEVEDTFNGFGSGSSASWSRFSFQLETVFRSEIKQEELIMDERVENMIHVDDEKHNIVVDRDISTEEEMMKNPTTLLKFHNFDTIESGELRLLKNETDEVSHLLWRKKVKLKMLQQRNKNHIIRLHEDVVNQLKSVQDNRSFEVQLQNKKLPLKAIAEAEKKGLGLDDLKKRIKLNNTEIRNGTLVFRDFFAKYDHFKDRNDDKENIRPKHRRITKSRIKFIKERVKALGIKMKFNSLHKAVSFEDFDRANLVKDEESSRLFDMRLYFSRFDLAHLPYSVPAKRKREGTVQRQKPVEEEPLYIYVHAVSENEFFCTS
eukprot:snap_masked-scaffold_1-processed-gene-32.11-mRNA-1 protein AED:0.46 eAED:0.46 QI:0/-1/0/1/-1/1/1/0/620